MRSKHIHACRQRELRDTLIQQPGSYSRQLRNYKLPFAEYCYACCEWSCSEDDWDNHCKSHLEKLELRCGLLSFRYTLVVAGYCPFCLGNEDLSPSQGVMVNSHSFLPNDITICNFQARIFFVSFSSLFWKERMVVYHNKERMAAIVTLVTAVTITLVMVKSCYGEQPFVPSN
jgi:hypothetical protein